MFSKWIAGAISSLALAALAAGSAFAQDIVKIGLVVPMTGEQASNGKQIKAGVDLYMTEHGDTVAGKKIEVILRDSGSVPSNTKRLTQELIVNDKVSVIAGFETTPAALAAAPLATEAKVVEVVLVAGTSFITERSPYIVRTSDTVAASCVIIADWAAQNGIKKVVSIVSDYAPGFEAEKSFTARFKRGRRYGRRSNQGAPGQSGFFAISATRCRRQAGRHLRLRARRPGWHFINQYAERGLDKAGIKLIGPGNVTDDDLLPDMSDAVIGTVTAYHYSTDHNSPKNKAYVAAFEKANGFRPNFISVAAYDGMHLVYEALKKTGGKADGDSLIAAMKGMKWESPRGPISIDPETRDIIQNEYIRRVEKKNGQLYNVEFATFEAVKDPIKAAEKK